MILSGKEIARHIGEEIVITPFNPKRLNPNSYNLTLADELMVYDNYELDMKKKNTGHLLKIPQEGYVLEPNKLYLVVPMNIRKPPVLSRCWKAVLQWGVLGSLYTLLQDSGMSDFQATGHWKCSVSSRSVFTRV